MHRLGFVPEEIPELIDRLKKQTAVIPRSVFSHFAGDGAQFGSFTRRQISFEAASECLGGFQHKILRHICNTADRTLSGCPVRYGAFGNRSLRIDPFTNQIIHNGIKTTILQIHEV